MAVPPATAVVFPPVRLVTITFGVVAILKPLGRASVNAIPVWAVFPAEVFAIVNVKVVVPPSVIVAGETDFVRLALGAELMTTHAPVPTLLVRLLLSPLMLLVPFVKAEGLLAQLLLVCPVTLVTSTVMVAVVLAAME